MIPFAWRALRLPRHDGWRTLRFGHAVDLQDGGSTSGGTQRMQVAAADQAKQSTAVLATLAGHSGTTTNRGGGGRKTPPGPHGQPVHKRGHTAGRHIPQGSVSSDRVAALRAYVSACCVCMCACGAGAAATRRTRERARRGPTNGPAGPPNGTTIRCTTFLHERGRHRRPPHHRASATPETAHVAMSSPPPPKVDICSWHLHPKAVASGTAAYDGSTNQCGYPTTPSTAPPRMCRGPETTRLAISVQ
jgi:hypothetical protein